jgi:ATP-dependent protease HslVU (ClpYQ) peptidase subunit
VDKPSSAEHEDCWNKYSDLRGRIAGKMINTQHSSQHLSRACIELAKDLYRDKYLVATVYAAWMKTDSGTRYSEATTLYCVIEAG